MRENCSVQTRERPVTKALKFLFCTRKFFPPSELERRVREGVNTERQDDRYGGRVPSKKRKKGYLENYSFFGTGSQWSVSSSGLTSSCLLLRTYGLELLATCKSVHS